MWSHPMYDIKRGSYEEAFCQHQKHFDEEIVQGWKEALREVAQMKGWELKKVTNGWLTLATYLYLLWCKTETFFFYFWLGMSNRWVWMGNKWVESIKIQLLI